MVTLDGTTSMWVIGILGFLLGTAAGCIIAYILTARNNRTHQLQLELNLLTERFADYRDQVSQHFMHTSDLVHEMTQSYRAVYEHLATGAQHLCSNTVEASTLVNSDAGKLAADGEYDELEELSNLRKDIDSLLGDTPRFSDIDAVPNTEESKSVQH